MSTPRAARIVLHACVDCRALPEGECPKAPRPAPHGGPRSRRCTTHQRAQDRATPARAAAARGHDHPEEVACPECFRGFLCHRDNRDVLGLLFAQAGASTQSVVGVLRALADYLEDPPMRRYLRQQENDATHSPTERSA